MNVDVLVVGSGFGGSVAALRLTEKGYRVAVLEAGRRYAPEDFPKTSWDVRRYLWAPRLGCRGILRLTRLRHAFVLSGAGVGGGSLVYANVLAEPAGGDPGLASHYATVRRMLGATTVPFETPADAVLRKVAERMGVAETFEPTEVAVDFERCVHCGGCMVGCRYGAKNTLDRTYLRLAERGGATIYADHEVRLVRRASAGWETVTTRSGAFTSEHVVLAAGVLGTLPLLFGLPSPPPMVGRSVRTNTETLVGATADRAQTDYSRGVAITSSIEPRPGVVMQPVRYPRGSNAMALLGRPLSVRRWAERTVILLCMGTGEDSLRLTWKGNGLQSERVGTLPPSRVTEATAAAAIAAEEMKGRPGRFRFDLPITAHILGGAVRGDTPGDGVVDRFHRVFDHPGLHVVDGSTVSRNLGVNPALTIAAQAEHAMAAWPRRGEADARPLPL